MVKTLFNVLYSSVYICIVPVHASWKVKIETFASVIHTDQYIRLVLYRAKFCTHSYH